MKSYVIITGSNGGIGKALANTFLASGYGVIAIDKTTTHDEGGLESFIQVDLQKTVVDEDYATEIFSKILNVLDGRPLKGLINNAAVQILGNIEELDRSAWQTTLDVNLSAPFIWTQGLLAELSSANGCVINIGSIHARLTKKQFVAYATSKAALTGLTRALAVELGDRVRVNAIEPAAIETEMLKAGFENNPELYEELADCHPQKRIGQPEEVAKLALSLIDGGMDFLHGSIIGIDGGVSGRLCDAAPY